MESRSLTKTSAVHQISGHNAQALQSHPSSQDSLSRRCDRVVVRIGSIATYFEEN
jgi:hypothetical protein